jgi:tetratricopeptide (TPR) repeat protein
MKSSTGGFQSKPGSRAESALEWLEFYSKQVTWGAVAVVVVFLGVLFYRKSQEAQARNASGALADAEQSLSSGNLPLAQSSLERLTKRYKDTEAGKVRVVLLAQVHYQKGEYQQGIAVLVPLATGADKYFTAGAMSLTGAGYEQLSKYAEAADSYQKAAAAALFDSDRDRYLAAQARSLLLAGKVAEAKALWEKLKANPASVAAAEARVRLGEISAKPQG